MSYLGKISVRSDTFPDAENTDWTSLFLYSMTHEGKDIYLGSLAPVFRAITRTQIKNETY